MKKETVLVLGANGQIGSELVMALRGAFGNFNVIATDIKDPNAEVKDSGPFEYCDVLDTIKLNYLFQQYKPTQVYLLAALLSAVGEQKPMKAWELNMNGLLNVLNLCVEYKVAKVYWPSSIAVFGPNTPRVNTPQYTVMDPNTVYGFSKQAGERWCEYYFNKYGLDVRSIRYPGIIGWKTAPGGGTTDYAVHIFYEAIKHKKYECFLSANTILPMMHIDDAIRGTLELMDAPSEKIKIRSSYNLAAISFKPTDLEKEILKEIPDFKLTYLSGDPRQKIANSWPQSIDDSFARKEWDWNHQYDLSALCSNMLENIKQMV
jgi:nucleoside-diphosphate-sugar epimerase